MANGQRFIVGCDEVGRGCLAGPVVAVAAMFRWDDEAVARREAMLPFVRDSKMLSAKQRVKAVGFIEDEVLGWAVGEVSPQDIDRINIHQASLLAMRRAVDGLVAKVKFDEPLAVLIDGRFRIPELELDQTAIIDGDADVFSIAAASILAKEYRDTLMRRLHAEEPAYGFDHHVGYATKQHDAAIREHGLTAHHRKSFCAKYLLADSRKNA